MAIFAFTTSNKEMALSLRKNIKEYEPKKAEHLAAIKGFTDIDFDVEIEGDIVALNAKSSYTDRMGECFWKAYMENIAEFFERNKANDSFVLGEFVKNLTAKTIVIRCTTEPRPSGGKYQRLSVEDGKFVVTFTDEHLRCNISEICFAKCEDVPITGSKPSSDDPELSAGTNEFSKDNTALPLSLRKNIKENEEARDKHLKEIASILGEEMTLRIEHEPLLASSDLRSDYVDRLGDILMNSVLGQLPELFRNKLDDDMCKEAFLDEVSKKTIVFAVAPTKRPSGGAYHRIRFEDGEMRVEFDADQVWTNVNDLANYNIEALL